MFRKYFFLLFLLLYVGDGWSQEIKVNCDNQPAWSDNFSKRGNPSEKIWIYPKRENLKEGSDIDYNFYNRSGKLNIQLIRKLNSQRPYLVLAYTNKNYPLQYGKIEVRAKCPTAKGVWPAIWLRPTRGLNEKVSGEIDLIEWISCFNKRTFNANFHLWGDFGGKKNNHTQYPKHVADKFDVTKYHVYSAEWDKEKLIVRVDGEEVGIWWAKDYVTWPFDYTYELCLDIGYGGWGASCGYDVSKLPQIFKVDWVKYYKLKE
ncbi:MAG: glycoside hydrolase family 16 protein [Prevotella sp.]|nr:glycoside hydrolase family 16 protein [Prevotella sp.]